MISLFFHLALSNPGMAPQMPPPMKEAMSTAGKRMGAGRPVKVRANHPSKKAPMYICPFPPPRSTAHSEGESHSQAGEEEGHHLLYWSDRSR